MNYYFAITITLAIQLRAAFGGALAQWTRSLWNPTFSNFNQQMEIAAVKARKSCTKLLREIYDIGALDDSRFHTTTITSFSSKLITDVLHPVPIEYSETYEHNQQIIRTCNLGTPTVSIIDNHFIKSPEMPKLLEILIHAHKNLRRAIQTDKTEIFYDIEEDAANQMLIKIQSLENMIHIINEIGDNMILSNLNIYDVIQLFEEGLHEYNTENELLYAKNVAEVMRIRAAKKQLEEYELDVKIQERMLQARQTLHQAEMRAKIQERNQSADHWKEWTQWVRMYYDIGTSQVQEFTQFGHKLTKVTIYDTILALVGGVYGITTNILYQFLFIIVFILSILLLTRRISQK